MFVWYFHIWLTCRCTDTSVLVHAIYPVIWAPYASCSSVSICLDVIQHVFIYYALYVFLASFLVFLELAFGFWGDHSLNVKWVLGHQLHVVAMPLCLNGCLLLCRVVSRLFVLWLCSWCLCCVVQSLHCSIMPFVLPIRCVTGLVHHYLLYMCRCICNLYAVLCALLVGCMSFPCAMWPCSVHLLSTCVGCRHAVFCVTWTRVQYLNYMYTYCPLFQYLLPTVYMYHSPWTHNHTVC